MGDIEASYASSSSAKVSETNPVIPKKRDEEIASTRNKTFQKLYSILPFLHPFSMESKP